MMLPGAASASINSMILKCLSQIEAALSKMTGEINYVDRQLHLFRAVGAFPQEQKG